MGQMIQKVFRDIQLSNGSAVPLHKQIALQIERAIRAGKFSDGERLPPTLDLVRLLGVSITCVQRTMEILDGQGLVSRHPRRGTFVMLKSARPSVGILVGPNLLSEQSHASRYIATAVKNEVNDAGLNPRTYHCLVDLKSGEGERSINELSYDLRYQRFIGFVVISGQVPASVGADQALPYVTFSFPRPDIDVQIDHARFVRESAEWLLRQRAKKLAFIYSDFSYAGSYDAHLGEFRKVVSNAGLRVPASAIVNGSHLASNPKFSGHHVDRAAYQAMVPIIKQWRRKRHFPDGIILQDDIMTRGIVAAIQTALGPKEAPPKMIVLTTEGLDHFYALPVARYAISSEEIAKKLVSRFTKKITQDSLLSEPELVAGRIMDSFC